MKGHIRKRGENSYSVVVYLGRDELTGKQKYKWYTVRGNKREAERFLAKKIAELEAGLPANPGKLTVGEYLRGWKSTPSPRWRLEPWRATRRSSNNTSSRHWGGSR